MVENYLATTTVNGVNSQQQARVLYTRTIRRPMRSTLSCAGFESIHSMRDTQEAHSSMRTHTYTTWHPLNPSSCTFKTIECMPLEQQHIPHTSLIHMCTLA